MHNQDLWHDTISDALREAVQALGGFKKVGAMLWPDQSAEHAATKLRDCLNHDRRERLTPDQVVYLMRLARQADCHVIAKYLMQEAGYAPPVPLDPEDQLARLQREFVDAAAAMQKMAASIADAQARVEKQSKLRAA